MQTPRNFVGAYKETLTQHKNLIKTNIYARELEQKYHKRSHRQYRSPRPPQTATMDENSNWPIESNVFTQALKSKLKNIPLNITPSSDYSKRLIREIKDSINSRTHSKDATLPHIDRSRYWSPPKLSLKFLLTDFILKSMASSKSARSILTSSMMRRSMDLKTCLRNPFRGCFLIKECLV